MTQELVSILIPVYNREKFIKSTVESALSQTYKNLEVIVVDNASTDKTYEILKDIKDSRLKIFKNRTNLGPHKNWKRCIEEASGKFGKILWSDDLIEPQFIETTLSHLDENVGFVITSIKGLDVETGKFFVEKKYYKDKLVKSNDYIKEVISLGNYPVSPGCALFRLSDLESSILVNIPNKIESDFSHHGIGCDSLIFLITASKYPFVKIVSEPLSVFSKHKNSITNSSKVSRLRLLYTLAQAYFCETFLTSNLNSIKILNSRIKLQLILYPKNDLNLRSIQDFYMKNDFFRFHWGRLLLIIFKNIQKKLARLV